MSIDVAASFNVCIKKIITAFRWYHCFFWLLLAAPLIAFDIKSKMFSKLASYYVLFHIHISSQVRFLSMLLYLLSIDNLLWWGIMLFIRNHVITLLHFLLCVVMVPFYAINNPTPVHHWYQLQVQSSICCQCYLYHNVDAVLLPLWCYLLKSTSNIDFVSW